MYFFTFDHKVGRELGENKDLESFANGGSNGMNLLYLFGVPIFNDGSKAIKHGGDQNLYSQFQSTDKMLSRAMMVYLGNFIKSGLVY